MSAFVTNVALLLLLVGCCLCEHNYNNKRNEGDRFYDAPKMKKNESKPVRKLNKNGLNPGGDHVCSYEDSATEKVSFTLLQETFVVRYFKKCNWIGKSCRNVSRLVKITKASHHTKVISVPRDNLYCCDGWMKDASKNCSTPVCSVACRNGGECVQPDECKCIYGFEGRYCQLDIDECKGPKNNCNQTCINTKGSFTCACERGYTIDKDGRSCNDIDECSKEVDRPCGCEQDDGVCEFTCVNTPGRYECKCKSGYELASTELCRDINECFVYPDRCDQKCVNKPGTYECSCLEGFRFNGKKCEDIDECADENGKCSDTCVNLDGGYVCTCPDGFYLTEDKRTCEVVKPTMKNMVLCQSDMIGELACENYKEKLIIINAMYGRLTADYCQTGNYTQNLRCRSDPTNVLRTTCENMQSCVLFLTDENIFKDPCPGIEKYLQVIYDCLE